MELLAEIILGEYAQKWPEYFSYFCMIIQIIYYIMQRL